MHKTDCANHTTVESEIHRFGEFVITHIRTLQKKKEKKMKKKSESENEKRTRKEKEKKRKKERKKNKQKEREKEISRKRSCGHSFLSLFLGRFVM